MVRKIAKNTGFTLIEVMIALAIFAVFVVSFMAAQGYNVSDSSKMRNELKLREYVSKKINEIVAKPPEFKDSLTLKADSGKFEDDENFKYEVTYKKFKIPDYSKIKGTSSEDEVAESENPIEKKIFESVSKNLESIIWQAEVKVIDDTTGNSLSMSTWLVNNKAEVVLEAL